MPAPVTVDFYYSPASPYAYLASTQMLQLQIETRCRVDWYPVSGRMLIAKAGYDYGSLQGRSGQFNPEYRRTDLERWARLYGVPYRDHSRITIPDPVRLALACVAARRFDAGQVFARALMKAVCVDGPDVIDDSVLIGIANDTAGIEPHLFAPMLDDPETAAIHQGLIDTAVAAGCFGVPSFVVAGREVVFGNDRLPLLRQAIREAQQAG
ncbi:2-hydroxychromene-2-carboxylate isomerase [Rhodocista pekingensis]|uniref:2-hydroxychromene-2-carboxylate isomerase n=1 Tax=Rhodocista pekingensis TaxID=201185 RepID=A0ABW2KU10_9PROT